MEKEIGSATQAGKVTRKHFLLLLGAVLAPLGLASAEWNFKDGEGSDIVKEQSNPELNGKISAPALCTWAREDDRGWFLTLKNGGFIQIPHHASLNFADGFIAKIHFSYDPEKIGRNNFADLFTKGTHFQQGYSVMAGRNGELMLNLKGFKPEYMIVKTNFKPRTDHRLEIRAGNGKVRVLVDNREVRTIPVQGKFNMADNRSPLWIGELSGYPFTGNIYDFSIAPFPGKDIPRTTVPAVKTASAVAAPTADPPGTVVVDNFENFLPRENLRNAQSFSNSEKIWVIRKVGFMNPGGQLLHSPSSPDSELSFRPELKGKYDVYVLTRLVAPVTALQFNPGGEEWIRVLTAGVGNAHRNVEVLLARGVDMTDKTFRIAPAGGAPFYLGALKFVPCGSGKKYTADPGVKIDRGSKYTRQKMEEESRKDIQRRIDSGFFRELRFVDRSSMPPLPPEAEKRGFFCFEQPWMKLLFPNSVPPSTAIPAPVVKLAPGEYEPLTLGVYSLKNQQLKLSCVKSFPAGISAKIGVVEPLSKRSSNYTGPSEFVHIPNYLEKTDTLTAKVRECRQFWITLHAPENIAPGKYNAEFELKSDTGKIRIPVTAEIRPFRLAPVAGYDIGFWVSFGGKTFDECRKLVEVMAQYGMTTFVAGNYFVVKRNGENDFFIDFEKSPVVAVADAMKEFRMPGNMIIAVDELNRGKSFGKLIRQLEEYARKHDWPPRVYTIIDEVPSHPHMFPQFTAGCKVLKETGVPVFADHIWYKTSRPLQKEIDAVSPYIDFFANRFNTRKLFYVDDWETMEKSAAQRGKKLLAYNSNNALTYTQTAGMRFNGGWFFRSLGAGTSGQLVWSFYTPNENPYSDLDGISTDWCYVYPPRGERGGGPAIDLEAFREGVDDLRYILTLEREIARLKKSGMGKEAEEGEKILKKISNSIDKKRFYENSVFIDSKWTERKKRPDGSVEVSGELAPPTGWNLADYAKAREEVADGIVRLQKYGKGNAR